MVGAVVKIEMDGGYGPHRVRSALTGLQAAASPRGMQVILADIGEHLLNVHKDRFDEQRAPDGTPWAPLSPETLARKTLRGVDKGKDGKRSAVFPALAGMNLRRAQCAVRENGDKAGNR